MVEFSSALDAVECSINIQRELDAYNAQAKQQKKIYLRIGMSKA